MFQVNYLKSHSISEIMHSIVQRMFIMIASNSSPRELYQRTIRIQNEPKLETQYAKVN